MNIEAILGDIETERERRLRGLAVPDPHANVLWERALGSVSDSEVKEHLQTAFNFAKSIKYHHVGLSSDIYFAHPLRVAAIGILLNGRLHGDVGMVGLLHNTLEVSDVNADQLASMFGKEISDQIVLLTVDRDLQWDKNYKTEYYKRLISGPLSVRIVKVLDKLDNLFLLGLNVDAEVREKYIAEIEEFMLPVVDTDVPLLKEYMTNLIGNCRTAGQFTNHLIKTKGVKST